MRITGHVTHRDMITYYRRADVYVSMSEHEGFGKPLIESMYCGLPVLAYASSAVPDTLGGAGVLFHHKDYEALAELVVLLLEDDDLRRRVIERQFARVQSFLEPRVRQQFVALSAASCDLLPEGFAMSDRTLHVALVSPAYPPLPGGGERYVAALARGLVAADAQVTVVTSAATAEADFWNGVETRSERDEAGVRVIRLPILPAAGGRDALMRRRRLMVLLSAMPGDQSSMLAGMARRFPAIDGLDETLDGLGGVDVVHGFNISWEHGLVAAHEYSRRAAVPLVVTPFAHLGESSLGRVARNSTMNHQLRLLRDAARVLVLTRLEADGLARYHVRPERLEVIGSGVDPIPDDYAESPYFSPEHHEARGNFGVYIGRQSFDKGALHAADAVRALAPAGSRYCLAADRLVGAGVREVPAASLA